MVAVAMGVKNVRKLLDTECLQTLLGNRKTGETAGIDQHGAGTVFDDPNVADVSVFALGNSATLKNGQTRDYLGWRSSERWNFCNGNSPAPGDRTVLIEAHELAFCFFHGVFRKLRYDNLTAAVKKIFQGYRREETARFISFRSHWRFRSEFCTPAEAHEKGGVEGEAGYFRRNHWVPVPEASDLTDLNRQLLAACHRDEGRWISGRNQSIGAALLV